MKNWREDQGTFSIFYLVPNVSFITTKQLFTKIYATHIEHMKAIFCDHFGFNILKKLLIFLKHVSYTPTWANIEKLTRHTINTGLNLFGKSTERKKDSNHCHKYTQHTWLALGV